MPTLKLGNKLSLTKKFAPLQLSADEATDAANIGLGLYHPVTGFMGPADIDAVISTGRTEGGSPIGLPLLLDVKNDDLFGENLEGLSLVTNGQHFASIESPRFFVWRDSDGIKKLFGTDAPSHPGVMRFSNFSGYFVTGQVKLNHDAEFIQRLAPNSPAAVKELLRERGWGKVVGFQTRNVPHKAHEQLIRTALEVFDGVLVQPLVGARKTGDFTEESINLAYGYLLKEVFPEERVLLSFLKARMNYGGPREAVLHSVMRRNFGCTHFIVGRDHAGVADFYGEYEAQEYCSQFGDDLGIEILNMAGPYFCSSCDTMVSRKSCKHSDDGDLVTKISGTHVRSALTSGEPISPVIARPEILNEARKGKLFI